MACFEEQDRLLISGADGYCSYLQDLIILKQSPSALGKQLRIYALVYYVWSTAGAEALQHVWRSDRLGTHTLPGHGT